MNGRTFAGPMCVGVDDPATAQAHEETGILMGSL